MALDSTFLDDLAAIVGPSHLRRSNELALLDPGVDEENLGAGLAVRPGCTREVSEILALSDRAGVSVVTHGGRTGLAKGATSSPGQIVLMTERFGEIDIDAQERVAVVGAGVTLQALQEACAEHGLSPGIDIAARGSATIGGMVSTNAGGMEAFRHGMMRQRVLGIEAVLADGSVLSDLAKVTKNNEGYDLARLMCGAEGTLGVVTRVSLRLVAADPAAQTVLTGASDATASLRTMRALQDAGILLRAEIMWAPYARIVAHHCSLTDVLGFCDAPVYTIFETAGDQDGLIAVLEPFLEDGTISDALLAQSDAHSQDIWRIREDSFAANREIAHPLWFDISLTVTALDPYVAKLTSRIEDIDPGLSFYALGHLADGNLHLTIGSAEECPPDIARAISLAVEDGIKDLGGSISAEHGIGAAKLAALSRNASPAKLAAMRRLKAAFDPNDILNPGKVIPT